MPLENLISLTYTAAELQTFDDSLTAIEAVLRPKAINLTPEERQQYGSIADSNKIIVDKSRDYMRQNPNLVPKYVDLDEFERDYQTRQVLENRHRRLSSVLEMLADTKVLLDHDNYTNAMIFYRLMRYMASENEPGTTVIYEDLKQQFSGGRPSGGQNEVTA